MKLRFALVGCGKIGVRHAVQMQRVGALVACADVDELMAKSIADQYDIAYFLSAEELFEAVKGKADVVAICTPNYLHAAQSIAAMKAGFHVLCEKPMALTTADGRQMMDVAQQYDRLLMVVKQNRFNAPVVAVKQLLEQEKLGAISSVQLNCFWNRNDAYYNESYWRGKKQKDGGILYTQFSHFIDLVGWFFGDVSIVAAIGDNKLHHTSIEIDDVVALVGYLKKNIVFTMHATINAHANNMEGSLTIFGAKGTVKIGGAYLNKIEYHSIEGVLLSEAEQSQPNDYGSYQGSMSNHDKVYDNLCAVLNNAALPYNSLDDSLNAVAIIESIHKSLQKV
jgi:UDP-N-acetyl-2-amino-2-deoxyglucuronate dehydrogenase